MTGIATEAHLESEPITTSSVGGSIGRRLPSIKIEVQSNHQISANSILAKPKIKMDSWLGSQNKCARPRSPAVREPSARMRAAATLVDDPRNSLSSDERVDFQVKRIIIRIMKLCALFNVIVGHLEYMREGPMSVESPEKAVCRLVILTLALSYIVTPLVGKAASKLEKELGILSKVFEKK